jgi:hypothetical protein
MVVKRKIVQISQDGQIVKYWESVSEAGKHFKPHNYTIASRNISACLTKKTKYSQGFKWDYADETISHEIWQRHPVYNLSCSNIGRIMFDTGGVTFGYKQKSGYRTIGIVHKGKKLSKQVHRLIMETFHPEEEILLLYITTNPQVDHINGIEDDNNLLNLQWMTPREHCLKTHKK